jgi:PST family polysaccharide transporter
MGFKKKFFKNIAVFGGYNYISWFFDTLVSTIILSRFLGPKEYGFVALITIFSGFILLFSNTGLSYSVIRSTYGLTFQKIVFNLSVWIGFTLAILMCLLAYPITLVYGKPELFWPTIVISLQFITSSTNIVPTAILQKRLEFNTIGKINLICTITTIAFMIILAILGFSYWSLIIPQTIHPIIKHAFLEYHTKFGFHFYGFKLTRFGFSKVKTLFKSISLFNFVNYFARNADNFAVGKFYGDASLGIYDRAYKFLYMARRLVNSTTGPVIFPSLVEAKQRGEDYKSHYLDILGMFNIANFFISFPLILFSESIVLVLWGEKWLGVTDFLPYIGAIIPLQILTIASDDLYMIEKNEKAYVTLGIPLSLILVIGIVIGAFFSPLHIIRFYALSFTLVQLPASLYFGHYKILKFSFEQILKFWLPKIILTNLLIFSIWFGNIYITSAIMFLLLIDTFYKKQKDLKKIFLLVSAKLKK